MGLFGFGKRRDVVDLSARYKEQQEKEAEASSDSDSNEATPFAFFNSGNSEGSSNVEASQEEAIDVSSAHEKKRKLAKRIAEMTGRLEDLSNQIYHLQQRIEVIEKKTNVNKY